MENNYSDYPQSLNVKLQAPIDAKMMVSTLDELKDLGVRNYKAFTYYNGMIINCLENSKWYQWTSNLEGKTEKLLDEDFIYPEGVEFEGFNYSEVAFNFIEFLQKGEPGKDGKDGIDGKDGKDGINGSNGNDGVSPPTKYNWIAFANNTLGKDISTSALNKDGTYKKYIGFAYDMLVETPSTNYLDYTWSLYVGQDGQDGSSGYTWIKFSMYPKGRDHTNQVSMIDEPYDVNIDEYMVYMGVAANKETAAESNTPEDYKWIKIKGDDGHTGYVLDVSNDNIAIPTDSDGVVGPTSLQFAFSECRLFYGNNLVHKDEYYFKVTASTGVNFQLIETNPNYHKIELKEASFEGTNGYIDIKIYSDSLNENLLASAKINIVKLIGLSSYEIVPSVTSIKVIPETVTTNESIEPATISAKIYKNTGSGVREVNEGQLVYKYSYQLSGDRGTVLEPGMEIQISNDNDPQFLLFNLYHPDNSSLIIDRESIPFIRDGKNGEDGQSSYVLDLSNDNHTIPTDSEGKTVSNMAYAGAETLISLFLGDNSYPLTDWTMDVISSSGIEFTKSDFDDISRKVVITNVNDMADSGYIDFVAKQKGTSKILGRGRMSLTKSKGTASYKLVPSVYQIIVEPNGTGGAFKITPAVINVKVFMNDGVSSKETTDLKVKYKYSDSVIENEVGVNTNFNISYAQNRSFIQLTIYDKNNPSIVLDRENIPFIKSNIPGVPGDRGPALRQLEWIEGYIYVNNSEFRDIIYYRSSNETHEGWYVVKGVSATANAGFPDLSLFEKQPFTESSIFGNIIAENANLAGFIFKAMKLFSQSGMEQSSNPTYSNLLLDGVQGFIRFLQNFLINKDGIYFSDPTATTSNKNRLSLEFINGIPRLRMWHPNGILGIEMGIINGELTLNFYDLNGNLIYNLGKGGIVYVDRIPASMTEIKILKLLSPYTDDSALISEYKNKIATRINETVNTGPNNKYTAFSIIENRPDKMYSYNAGKNETSETNKQYELYWKYSHNGPSSHSEADKFTGVVAIHTQNVSDSFQGVRDYYGRIEYNRPGWFDPVDFTQSVDQGGRDIKVIIFNIVNGVSVEQKQINLGALKLYDVPSS